jgi:leucyl-tRNA synthetase
MTSNNNNTKSKTTKKREIKNKEETKVIDWSSIEKKWNQRWEKNRLFETDPDLTKKKYFITVAYPYPNSPQHIGHGRTYTLADAHARYMRMKGYNVLFPMGFHYTGTPILGMSRRIASEDKELLQTFRNIYHVSDVTIKSFVEPVKIASYFHNEIKLGMKEMGYSIDWRREFTTIDKVYSKFISWQFRTLLKKGLIAQGSHPVGWCPKDQNPVSQHDTIGDVEPDFNEYILIKFELEQKDINCDNGSASSSNIYILPAATLRPETIFGVTNLWVNPKIEYVKVQLDHERWIVSMDAARRLEFLNHKVMIESTLKGEEIIGKYVKHPIKQVSIPIYPAAFVDAHNGTGIVMSVPAHAPYDYQALDDLKRNISIKNNEFNLKAEEIVEPIKIIEPEDQDQNFGAISDSAIIPAAEILKKFKVEDRDDPQLQNATNELYSYEFYKGKMSQNTGEYKGMSVAAAREKIKKEIILAGFADEMLDLINKPVMCRCGTECVVKLLNDQWFINYGDRKWKDLAHECIDKMDIVPEEIRQEFKYTLDWLKERACARKSGLGTKLPWDKDWIIESLSDSVVYMAYYIIAKYVTIPCDTNGTNNSTFNNENSLVINGDDVKDSFFDYVLLGKGDIIQTAQDCKLPTKVIEDIRSEFSYFYPLDSRHSGRDLIPNHLSFFIFNHVAIFERENWPKQIVVNGSVLMEGKKMSKSFGNIIPLRSAIKDYGADTIRLAILISAELLQDAEFSFDIVKGIRSKLYDIYNMAMEHSLKNNNYKAVVEKKVNEDEIRKKEKQDCQVVRVTELEDRWLLSKLRHAVIETTSSMDKLRMREALQTLLYSLDQDLQWYMKRVKAKGRENSITSISALFLKTRVRMLAPFAPFTSEEVWEKIGHGGWGHSDINGNNNSLLPSLPSSIIFAGWPKLEEPYHKEDEAAEESEELIMNLISDIQKIIKVTKISPTKIVIYTAAYWKQKVYQKVLASMLLEGNANFGVIMKQLLKDPQIASKSKSDPNLVRKMMEDILSTPLESKNRRLKMRSEFNEVFPINDAKSLISFEAGNGHTQIIVCSEDSDAVGDITSDNDTLPKKHDPKSKARLARPYKPAIYIE